MTVKERRTVIMENKIKYEAPLTEVVTFCDVIATSGWQGEDDEFNNNTNPNY